MLDADLKTQLKAYLEKVTQPIELVASFDDGDSSRELEALLLLLLRHLRGGEQRAGAGGRPQRHDDGHGGHDGDGDPEARGDGELHRSWVSCEGGSSVPHRMARQALIPSYFGRGVHRLEDKHC